jgi:hypothetical protein
MKNELSIEQKMKVIRFALENGANIDINFHEFSQADGEVLAAEISGMTKTKYEKRSGDSYQWFSIYKKGLYISVFYKQSIEEKKSLLLAELAALEKGEQVNEATN